jgi:RNA-binding protein
VSTELTGKQKRYLRSLGHDLQVVLQIGKDGITDGVIAALGVALVDHELVKVKFGRNATLEKEAASAELAKRSKSALVQVLGNSLLLYKPRPDEPTIVLPTAKTRGKDAPDKPKKRGTKPERR